MRILIFLAFFVISLCCTVQGKNLYHMRTMEVETNDVNSQYCQCLNYTCGCCSHWEVEKIGLNDTICVNLTYLPNEYGISFTVSIDKRTVYNETISAKNPPPVCFGVPYLKEFAAICVKFHDLSITSHKFHGCVGLEARLGHIEVAQYELGCFDIGTHSLHFMNDIPQIYVV